MRLAVISDVHGNLLALEAVLADVRRHAPDAIVNLGDCVTSPLWPRETYDLLETLACPTVLGNHDRWLAEPDAIGRSPSVAFAASALTEAQRAALGALPQTIRVHHDVLAVHGTPNSDTEYLMEEAVDDRLRLVSQQQLRERLGDPAASLVLCGHSHTQHTMSTGGGCLVVNPGSVGCPRYADNEDPFVAEASSPHARYAVVTQRGGQWSADLVVLAYDWFAVAERARQNGRDDWAAGFLRDGR